MSRILPNPFALKSKSNQRYLSCGQDGLLQFTDPSPTSYFFTDGDEPRNGDEPRKVNVRGSNNKYWERAAPDQNDPPYEIRCTADKPHEAIDKNCTLFEFTIVEQINPKQVVVNIHHVQLRRYLRPTDFQGSKDALGAVDPIPEDAVDPSPDGNAVEYLFTAVGSS